MGLFGKKKEESCCGGGGCGGASDATVKVLGGGCARCESLEAEAVKALEELGMDATVGHVRDFAQIASYGVMTTPALMIDGKVVSQGMVLRKEQIVDLLRQLRA